jgi:site-specific recombinase XerD
VRYADERSSVNTRIAYESDWRDFSAYCENARIKALPAKPSDILAYATDLRTTYRLKPATVRRRIYGISQKHLDAGHVDPSTDEAVKTLLRSLRKSSEKSATAAKRPLRLAGLAKVWKVTCGEELIDLRDWALILTGLATALERERIVSLDVRNLLFAPDRLVIRLPRTDSTRLNSAREIEIPRLPGDPYCAVAALEAWLDAAVIDRGPVFRSFRREKLMTGRRLTGRGMTTAIQQRFVAAGLSAELSSNSLRYGAPEFARFLRTSALRLGTLKVREDGEIVASKMKASARLPVRLQQGPQYRRFVAAQPRGVGVARSGSGTPVTR